jgi:hypothetical protein
MQALRSSNATSSASKSFPAWSIPHSTRKVFELATKVLPLSLLQTRGVVAGGPGEANGEEEGDPGEGVDDPREADGEGEEGTGVEEGERNFAPKTPFRLGAPMPLLR